LRADLSPARRASLTMQSYQVPAAHDDGPAASPYVTGRPGVIEQKLALDAEGKLVLALEDGWTGVRLSLELAEHARFDRFVPVPVTAGTLDLGVLVLSAGGAISGFVGGVVPDPSWTVTLLPRGGDLPSFVQRGSTGFVELDRDGRFHFEHVPPGTVELTLSQRFLGAVLERELEVREGATTPFEFTYNGREPSRALFVSVGGLGRLPTRDELWLTDAHGNGLAPSSIDAARIVFAELGEGAYTLTLSVEGHEPAVKRDLRRGTRVEIGFPPVPPSPAARQKLPGRR